ncbi:hypothetical protein [Sphingomonas sp.]|jgi:hypothetical protein|uniref:hypothetical protein n=1 Tax=Sphingomonas sp. TaxID=28214 RepID=UPI002EDB5B76
MKTFAILAAAAAAMFAVPASAATVTAAPSTVVTATALASSAQVRVVVRENRGRHRGWSRGHNRRASWRRVCNNRWRNGHRVRVCRNVRYWRR